MMHKQKTKNFSLIAEATKTAVAVLVAGKFETLGSNFSHETVCSDPKKLDFFETTLVVSFFDS